MGQKVNPHGIRVGVIKDWDSRWFAKDNVFGDTLVEDYNLRKVLKKQLAAAGVPKIEIERDASKVRVHIHCAKPGMVIGKGGAEIEKLRLQCEKMLKKPNYLTVPAALKELEKIVMIRQLDGVYRLDHTVTATQKTILDAFGLNEGNVRYQAKEIEKNLQHQ